MTLELLKIVWALATVIVLVYVFAKLLGRKQYPGPSGLPVKSIGYIGLGPRRGIAVLKAGREVLLVGLTQTEIRLLRAYPEEEFLREKGPIERKTEQANGFKRFLQGGGLFNEKTPQ
ncbi:MAG: hypothetical protein D6778_07005 [Nitrospirae bacterium]|nr:MAG: hypothetical protein D6778_07005 [Nitrospirota bacterium]